jgi:hypothetical protein
MPTEGRIAAVRRYNRSQKAREAQYRYRATEAGQINRFLYEQTPARKMAHRLREQVRRAMNG